MRWIVFVTVAAVALVGVAAYGGSASGQPGGDAVPIYGITNQSLI